MTRKLYLPLLMAVVAVLTSCNNKLDELSSDYFTVTPPVLEAIGGKVPATIDGKFPEKYFKKKAVVEVTPVLKWEGGEARGESVVFQGEKVEGNDQTINYKAGGTYTMKTSFDYVPEMAKSELYLEFNAKVGSKVVEVPAVKVADGVYRPAENNTEATTQDLVVSENGKLTIKGIDLGEYTLKETVAPDGYVLPDDEITITLVDVENNGPDGKLDAASSATGTTVRETSVSGQGTKTLALGVDNTNYEDAGFQLPKTGGMGTMLFTIAGIILMGGAVALIVAASRRKRG